MHSAGKLTSLTAEDMFNDNSNIEALADKCQVECNYIVSPGSNNHICLPPQVPEEVRCLLEDLKAKSNGTDEKSALLQ